MSEKWKKISSHSGYVQKTHYEVEEKVKNKQS